MGASYSIDWSQFPPSDAQSCTSTRFRAADVSGQTSESYLVRPLGLALSWVQRFSRCLGYIATRSTRQAYYQIAWPQLQPLANLFSSLRPLLNSERSSLTAWRRTVSRPKAAIELRPGNCLLHCTHCTLDGLMSDRRQSGFRGAVHMGLRKMCLSYIVRTREKAFLADCSRSLSVMERRPAPGLAHRLTSELQAQALVSNETAHPAD